MKVAPWAKIIGLSTLFQSVVETTLSILFTDTSLKFYKHPYDAKGAFFQESIQSNTK